ncbi:MAG: glycosyltransferase [Bacteroidia bacterium]
MKVLWFVGSSLNGTFYRTFWISSLLNQLSKQDNLELGICFMTSEKNAKAYRENDISYFPVSSYKTFFHRFSNRLLHTIKGANNFNDYINVVKKFNPDLINIFGLETEYAEIIPHVKCKSIVHIQGILSPLTEFWHIPNKTNRDVFWASNPINLIFAVGIYHSYFRILKSAQRERKMLEQVANISGRTDWDKSIMKVLAPEAKYFHIDEVIRHDFFETAWEYKHCETITIITIIGDSLYKGYDIILKTSALLCKHGLKFNWKIFGINNQSESVKIIEKMVDIKHSVDIQLLGHADSKTIIEQMKKAHLYIHPSKIENSSNSVCEAMLLGMPVIAADTGGMSTMIENKVNGLLFSNIDFYTLANIILQSIKQPAMLKQLGKNARETAFKRHDKEKIVNDLITAYKKIISE